MTNHSHIDIILASQSPRRQQLLQELGFHFRSLVLPHISEEYPSNVLPHDIPLFLAKQKAEAYHSLLNKNSLLITADTMVFLNNIPIGKPRSVGEAKAILRKLSNTSHQVITGVCLQSIQSTTTFSSRTIVEMAPISEEEITHYIAQYSPLDKAGSYGIQEWIGYAFVKSITGSYSNVMGLPTQPLYQKLNQMLRTFSK